MSEEFFKEAGIFSTKWRNASSVRCTLPLMVFNAQSNEYTMRSRRRKAIKESVACRKISNQSGRDHFENGLMKQFIEGLDQRGESWKAVARRIGHRENDDGKFAFEGRGNGLKAGDCIYCGIKGHNVDACPHYCSKKLAFEQEHGGSRRRLRPATLQPGPTSSTTPSSLLQSNDVMLNGGFTPTQTPTFHNGGITKDSRASNGGKQRVNTLLPSSFAPSNTSLPFSNNENSEDPRPFPEDLLSNEPDLGSCYCPMCQSFKSGLPLDGDDEEYKFLFIDDGSCNPMET